MNNDVLLNRVKNSDDAETVEMLELLEDIDTDSLIAGEDEDRTPLPVESECPVCSNFMNIHHASTAPQVILDQELKIRWRNSAYSEFRETPGLTYNYRERTFDDFFSTFTGDSSESKIERTDLFVQLNNPDSGYTWQGSVDGVGPNFKSFIASLTIKPLVVDDDAEVRYFEATLQDITTGYQDILQSSYEGILKASLLKDEDTGKHIERVNTYSRLIAEKLLEEKKKGDLRWIDIDENFVDDISQLAAFHDVGKIGTPEHILLKGGKLNDEEWKVMKEHPINGALVLSSHPKKMAGMIARTHHERWDGTGYPSSEIYPEPLSGENIPLCGRIVALSDVYDALRTRRPYKEPFTEEKTSRIIAEGSGSHFDPGIVDVFIRSRLEFDRVFRELGD